MIAITLVITIVVLVLFMMIVPIIHYIVDNLYQRMTCAEHAFYFPSEIVEGDVEYRQNGFVDRVALSNRGWVRAPKGEVRTEETFEEMKRAEYSINLP